MNVQSNGAQGCDYIVQCRLADRTSSGGCIGNPRLHPRLGFSKRNNRAQGFLCGVRTIGLLRWRGKQCAEKLQTKLERRNRKSK